MPVEEEPKLRFAGRNFDEQAYSIQQFTIGQSILQRFGQQMTEQERNYMIASLRMFVKPPEGELGGVEPAPSRREQPAMEHPTQVPPAPAPTAKRPK